VCRQGFCRIIKRVLQSESFGDFHHGDLSLIGGSAIGRRAGAGASEVFAIMTDAGFASRLVRIFRACPIRADADDFFALYTVGD
jgi:hypothetical protein